MSGIYRDSTSDSATDRTSSGQYFSDNSKSAPLIIHFSHELIETSKLSPELRKNLQQVISTQQPEAFLRSTKNSEMIPLQKDQYLIFRKIQSGCSIKEGIVDLSLRTVQRLFISGVLALDVDGVQITGPQALLFAHEDLVGKDLTPPSTDALSYDALTLAARMRLADPAALFTRLYLYNQHPIFASAELDGECAAVRSIITSCKMSGFKEVPPPELNSGWHFFEGRKRFSDGQHPELGFKVYISPAVGDVAPCLAQLYELIPRTLASGWKVGRDIFGITRPDKICVYFTSQQAANDGGRFFAQTLQSIKAQGIPFTYRYDTEGLVAGGMDPPRPKFGLRATFGTSWRDWVGRRLASAIILAQSQNSYGMTPQDAALWSMRFLGVQPENWTATDSDFWRS